MLRIFALIASAACALGESGPPSFRAEDVRPHAEAEPHPLAPGLLTWIFGDNLGNPPGCVVANTMDPATYKTELCGTRVLVGGIQARLIFVSEKQINLVLPNHPWENELVDFQVIHDGLASPLVPVRFGFNRPVLSLDRPAFAGMPVWLRVEKPWGTGRLGYPVQPVPWTLGPLRFDVRFQGKLLAPLPFAYAGRAMILGTVALPHEPPREYLDRVPLHLVYPLDRPGTYRVRYTEYRFRPGTTQETVYQQSQWTAIEVLPSTPEQRRAWLQLLSEHPPDDPVELLANYLPSLLAARSESALRLLSPFLNHPDPLVRQYAEYGLSYFGSTLLERVLPGHKPLQTIVR